MFLPAATKLIQGNIFTSVCLSTGGFWSQGSPIFQGGSPIFRGVSNFSGVSNFLGGCLQFFGGLQFFEGVSNFSEGLQFFFSMRGWYASYWNAFLLQHELMNPKGMPGTCEHPLPARSSKFCHFHAAFGKIFVK